MIRYGDTHKGWTTVLDVAYATDTEPTKSVEIGHVYTDHLGRWHAQDMEGHDAGHAFRGRLQAAHWLQRRAYVSGKVEVWP